MDLDNDDGEVLPEEDNSSNMPKVGLRSDSTIELQHHGLCIGADTNLWASYDRGLRCFIFMTPQQYSGLYTRRTSD